MLFLGQWWIKMDRSQSIPLLCCGCAKLGAEVTKLSKKLSPSGEYPSYTNNEFGVLLEGVCHLESEWSNSARIAEVLEKTRDLLEKNATVRGLAFLNELGVGFGLPALLISEIKDNFPELAITSFLLAPAGGISGLSSINSLITLQAVMEFTDHVMIREVDEARSYISSELSGGPIANNQPLPQYNLGEVYQCIASDILVALSSHWGPEEGVRDNYLWPFNVCTTSKKLFDVRSSLWKSLARSSKSRTIFNPMRAVSSSIHSLHLWNADPLMYVRPIATAAVVDFKFLERSNYFETSHCTVLASDVAVALEWATPKVSWPKYLGVASYRDSSSGCLVNASTRSKSTAAASANSGSGKSLGNVSAAVNQFAISFESPYARIAVDKICNDVSSLLRVNAFSHR